MTRKRNLLFLPISLFVGSIFTLNIEAKAGITSGADIYCVMRAGGNSHEPSWEAAYQNIKKQKAGLFKTSPKQAASLIVEEVVSEPDKYQDCISYLGDLYRPKKLPEVSEEEINENELNDTYQEQLNKSTSKGNYDRYDY